MKEKLSSGNYVDITLVDVSTAYKLLQTVLTEFKKDGIKLGFGVNDEITSFSDLIGKNVDGFISGLMNVICSDKVLEMVLECGKKCFYEVNGIKSKITLDSFEKEESRSDFLEVLYKIALANLKPFFPKALTK